MLLSSRAQKKLTSIESTWTQKIQIKYIDTQNQLADIITKGNFTSDEWNHLLCLFNISNFSSINSVKAMSKRTQKDAGEERVTAKSKPSDAAKGLLTCQLLLHQKAREKPIKRNPVGSRHVSHCRLLPFMIILITASLSSKMYNKAS